MRCSVNPAAMQVGQQQGVSGVSSALGDIPCPYQPPGQILKCTRAHDVEESMRVQWDAPGCKSAVLSGAEGHQAPHALLIGW
jgi:hypothetical protein